MEGEKSEKVGLSSEISNGEGGGWQAGRPKAYHGLPAAERTCEILISRSDRSVLQGVIL